MVTSRHLVMLIIAIYHGNVTSVKFRKQWAAPLINPCIPDADGLLNLANLACSTAQPLNITIRDACYGCFARFVALPTDDSQLLALTLCASTYFAGTPYAPCAVRLASSGTGLAPINQCNSGYCQFVQCLRGVNSNSLVIQCSREVQATTPINIATDNGAIFYFSNITSCILAKIRCSLFNPITGSPQLPGVIGVNNFQPQIPLYNTLQITTGGTLRVISIPGTVAYPPVFCSAQNTFAQSNWLNNVCP